MNLQYQNHNVPRQQTQMDPGLQRGVENPLRGGRYLAAEPPGSRVLGGRETPGPPPPRCEDTDGDPLDEEDPELARKKKMLQKLNEKILHKKAAIAIRTVKVSMKDPPEADGCRGEQTNLSEGGSLRDRVTQILLQHQFSLYSKVKRLVIHSHFTDHFRVNILLPEMFSCRSQLLSSEDRTKPFTLSREGLQQDQHPLKLRVKALRTHRIHPSSLLPSNTEVYDVFYTRLQILHILNLLSPKGWCFCLK